MSERQRRKIPHATGIWQGTKILHATRCDQRGEKKKRTSTVDHNLGGPVVENLPANAGDTGLIPGPGRSHMPQDN